MPEPVGADQQDVRLGQFHIAVLRGMRQTLVMVVDGDGEHLLRMPLADHVIIEDVADLLRSRHTVTRTSPARISTSSRMISMHNSTHSSHMNTVGPRDELANFVLALAAERAVKRALRVVSASFAHTFSPIFRRRPAIATGDITIYAPG